MSINSNYFSTLLFALFSMKQLVPSMTHWGILHHSAACYIDCIDSLAWGPETGCCCVAGCVSRTTSNFRQVCRGQRCSWTGPLSALSVMSLTAALAILHLMVLLWCVWYRPTRSHEL